jgi:hypothetical protein
MHQQIIATLHYGQQMMTLNMLQTLKSFLTARVLLFLLLSFDSSDNTSGEG